MLRDDIDRDIARGKARLGPHDEFQRINQVNPPPFPQGYASGTATSAMLYQEPLEPPTGRTDPFSIFEPNFQIAIQLSNELRALLEEVKELRSELRSRPQTSSILLINLSNSRLTVHHPISVILEESDDGCLARWPEVNAYGLGPTLPEAIVDLKQNIVNLFVDLSARDEGSLGELAIDTLNTLMAYIWEK
jgi:hypothetical protein